MGFRCRLRRPPPCISLWQLDRDHPLLLESWDGAPDNGLRILVAARPSREQAEAGQLALQEAGLTRAARDLLELVSRKPKLESLVDQADIAEGTRVIVTFRQPCARFPQIDQAAFPVVVDVPLKGLVGPLRGRVGRCRAERRTGDAKLLLDESDMVAQTYPNGVEQLLFAEGENVVGDSGATRCVDRREPGLRPRQRVPCHRNDVFCSLPELSQPRIAELLQLLTVAFQILDEPIQKVRPGQTKVIASAPTEDLRRWR